MSLPQLAPWSWSLALIASARSADALIASASAPDVPAERFAALTRLDHNRAVAQVASALDRPAASIERMTIWGNHSSTQYPDVRHATIDGGPVLQALDQACTFYFVPARVLLESDCLPEFRVLRAADSATRV